jgi:hypothetical protein
MEMRLPGVASDFEREDIDILGVVVGYVARANGSPILLKYSIIAADEEA